MFIWRWWNTDSTKEGVNMEDYVLFYSFSDFYINYFLWIFEVDTWPILNLHETYPRNM